MDIKFIIPSTVPSSKHTQPCLLVVCEEGGDVVLEPFILCMGLQIILNHRVVELRHLVHRHHGEAVEQATYYIFRTFCNKITLPDVLMPDLSLPDV